MNLTTLILLLFISILLIYALYDEMIIDWRKGKTRLKIPLLRGGRADGLVFAGLVLILLWQNIRSQGAMYDNWLLAILAALAFYSGWLRQSKVLFKDHGFFFSGRWIDYQQIKTMNLSQDGVLVIGLEKRQLLIRVRHIDDLEKIYNLLISLK